MFVGAMAAYPVALALQVGAVVLLFKQAKRGDAEPGPSTKALIGAAFLSLALPVLVFLAYAVRGAH
jgi:ABC-type amino acid transport system permease subunit